MDIKVTKKYIGNKIRVARESIGLSQAELGREFGWSQSNISDIERGITGIEAIDLLRMAQVLGRPLTFFFGLDSEEERLAIQWQKLEEQFRLLWEEAKRLGQEMERREEEK